MDDYKKELQKTDWGIEVLFILLLMLPFILIYWGYKACVKKEENLQNKNKKRIYK